MLIKNDYNNLTLPILKKLSKKAKIKYNKLNKQDMFINLNIYLAVITIQKYYRKHFYKNATDHITLEKVEYPCFIFRTKCCKNYFYSYGF